MAGNTLTMLLDDYHRISGREVRISPTQASRFAKEIAGDYNPIHDADAKRFCVPGDLLFALVLHYYGLYEHMTFGFRGMLTQETPLIFPETDDATIPIADQSGKTYLEVERAGEVLRDTAAINAFTRHYVSFSGRNFPHFLHPLLARQGVMFNPDRPLVIYDSMGFELSAENVENPYMELVDSRLEVAGRRGEAYLDFRITAGGGPIGRGSKKLVVSGLRDYDAERMEAFIADFEHRSGRRR